MAKVKSTCMEPGCERKEHSRNLCAPHYRAWYRKQPGHPTCSDENCDQPVAYRGLCNMHYTRWYRASKPRKYPAHHKVCEYCAHPYTTKRNDSRYCTLECAQRDYWGWSKNKDLVPYVKPSVDRSRTLIHVRTTRRLTAGQCNQCGAWFVSLHMDVTCSSECKRKARQDQRYRARSRRRAIKKEAYVEHVYRKRVFERDGYRCHMCKRKLNPKHAVPHLKAPTIDHIVPLAAGGKHETSNCATACFQCNSTKGHRYTPDQLLLFA